ncbi:MAG: hypothetical protein M3Q41_13930, partial [Pseudomonadota bacterium]|nr:hypothetical protein [Pseudomonadota bacterium]
EPESAALNQDVRVIVNDLREQARSHIWIVSTFDFAVASPHSTLSLIEKPPCRPLSPNCQ